jgi:hypothetical protein
MAKGGRQNVQREKDNSISENNQRVKRGGNVPIKTKSDVKMVRKEKMHRMQKQYVKQKDEDGHGQQAVCPWPVRWG